MNQIFQNMGSTNKYSNNIINMSSITTSPTIFDEYDSDCETTTTSTEVDGLDTYCEEILQEWDRNDHKNVESYLNIFEYSERKTIIDDLNTCDCCPRHQTNRPTLTDFMKGTMERVNLPKSGNVLKTYEYKCNCKCRQLARSVCRTNNQVVIKKKVVG